MASASGLVTSKTSHFPSRLRALPPNCETSKPCFSDLAGQGQKLGSSRTHFQTSHEEQGMQASTPSPPTPTHMMDCCHYMPGCTCIFWHTVGLGPIPPLSREGRPPPCYKPLSRPLSRQLCIKPLSRGILENATCRKPHRARLVARTGFCYKPCRAMPARGASMTSSLWFVDCTTSAPFSLGSILPTILNLPGFLGTKIKGAPMGDVVSGAVLRLFELSCKRQAYRPSTCLPLMT